MQILNFPVVRRTCQLSFFCPLDGNIEDSEYSEMQSAGNRYLKSYEWEIRELLEMEQSSPEDEMAQFFDDDESVKAKLVSAVWTVDEYKGKLYGRINAGSNNNWPKKKQRFSKSGWLDSVQTDLENTLNNSRFKQKTANFSFLFGTLQTATSYVLRMN